MGLQLVFSMFISFTVSWFGMQGFYYSTLLRGGSSFSASVILFQLGLTGSLNSVSGEDVEYLLSAGI